MRDAVKKKSQRISDLAGVKFLFEKGKGLMGGIPRRPRFKFAELLKYINSRFYRTT